MLMNSRRWLWLVSACGWLLACQREPVQLAPAEEQPALPSAVDLWEVRFVGEIGYAVGGDRYETTTLLRSTDAGQNWTPLDEGGEAENRVMYRLLVRDAQSVLAAGLHQRVLSSLDGGQSWRGGFLPFFDYEVPVRALVMLDSQTVMLACGGGYDSGAWYRSRNFGLRWERLDTVKFDLRDMVFTSPEVGYTSGYGVIFKTIDGGDSWDLTPAEDDFFVAMDFPAADVGYAVGRTGTILKTTDAAINWQRVRNGGNLLLPRHRYRDVAFWDEQTGYVVGDGGLLLRTDDGGESWTRLATDLQADIYGLHLLDANQGVLVGETGLLGTFGT